MTKRPLVTGLMIVAALCLGLATIDAVVIVTRPLWPWFAWMYP